MQLSFEALPCSRPESEARDARVKAEATAFAEALRRIGDVRFRACIRWFVIELANDR